MEESSLEFLKELLKTPSPSGYEVPIQKVVREYVGQFNCQVNSPVEVISLDDLQNAADLIARFCLSVDETSDFTP